MHIPLIEVSTHHLDYIISVVLLFSFFGGLIPLLVSRDNLFMLRSCDLRSLSALQEDGIFYYHLILESLDIL